jgi:hypothetical protein
MSQNESLNRVTIKQLIAEAAEWCMHRASLINAKQSLRTLPLNIRDLSSCNRDQLRQVVDDVFQERRRLLGSGSKSLSGSKLARGRLLICYPEESVWDGAAEAASRELFDVGDNPPWDTWCHYGIDDRLEPGVFIVSWVPPNFIQLAQRGIDVNPVESIQWASRFDNGFTRALKNEGLL